ncbi:unnamed protein product [Mycena citricolor]|uniref:BTB domain-containing protein n=1 Tax=Mycena citricolor TaxID=2018698 RepID=A0AAD2HUV1_9AGAR|nr:unnamed protein product [Mycena citricolor]
MSSTVKDLAAGTAGGIAQVLVGQPFDIVKVRMQTSAKGTYTGMMHCATGILKNEGPLAFYKGTLTPLLGIGVCVSIQFGVLESTKRFFAERNRASGTGGADGKLLSDGQIFSAGVAAGLANGFVSGPVEHIRIRLQTQSSTNPTYKGPLDAIKKIYSAHGIAGVFKGQGVTFVREAAGYGIYFLAYEKLVQREMAQKGIKREQISPLNAVLYGAGAGYALWAIIYPIDMIKSRMQTDGFSAATGRKYSSSLDCVRKVFQAEGFAAFTRGLTPTLIRWVLDGLFFSLVTHRFAQQITIRQWGDVPRIRDGQQSTQFVVTWRCHFEDMAIKATWSELSFSSLTKTTQSLWAAHASLSARNHSFLSYPPLMASDPRNSSSSESSIPRTSHTVKRQSETTRSDEFWYHDGSIIVLANGVMFRVHQTVLAAHSEVFSSLFNLPQPPAESNELVDGCRVVELHDAPEDVASLLRGIYNPSHFDSVPTGLEGLLTWVSGMLRLSTKYFIPTLRLRCITVLKTKFPTTLAEHDLVSVHREHKRHRKSDQVMRAIKLATECDVREILPYAYFCTSRASLTRILTDAPGDVSWREKAICLAGRERLRWAEMSLSHSFLFAFAPSATCVSPLLCAVARGPRKEWREIERAKAPNPLRAYTRWAEMNVCGECVASAQAQHRAGRAEVWTHLPTFFELPDWGALVSGP